MESKMRVSLAPRLNRTVAYLTVMATVVIGGPEKAVADDTLTALARIQLLENSRRTERSKWRPLVNHKNPMVRVVALRGAARIQSSKLVSLIESQLKHESPLVRAEAAFAYGRLTGMSSAPIAGLLKTEKDCCSQRSFKR